MKSESNRKHVIVRTYSAGVHYGELIERNGKEVQLANARRIWGWTGANTLHEIALRGVGKGSKVSESVSAILLTEAIEILDCADEAIAKMAERSWGT